jgi:hypothetical protein
VEEGEDGEEAGKQHHGGVGGPVLCEEGSLVEGQEW